MIGIFHKNAMKQYDLFELAVPLKKANMYVKAYQPSIIKSGLTNTIYEPIMNLLLVYLVIEQLDRNVTETFDNTLASNVPEPIVEEKNSLDALKIFITHACEILGLWKILCENQLNKIINCLSKDQLNQFTNATFRDIILIGHEISSLLIIHLIER